VPCSAGARPRRAMSGPHQRHSIPSPRVAKAEATGKELPAEGTQERESPASSEDVGIQHSRTGSPLPKMERQPAPAKAAEWHGGVAELVWCFAGLQLSYLIWGYIQEKIMTTEYRTGKFPSATFCVFSNRVLAIAIAAIGMLREHGRLQILAPFVAFAPCSVSNSVSSFAQYQALRYVSFPLQTLSKSAKVIPVMLIGRLLNGKRYSAREYMEALVISAGVSMFSFSEKAGRGQGSMEHQALGILTLAMYLVSDSFTSQWQSRVYKEHPKVDQFQMMFATNTWSILLTLVALIAAGELWVTIAFLVDNPAALLDNMAIAITSAVGQLFIFQTIRTFGPVVFTIIMTTRQMFSMVLSAVVFGHALGVWAYLGAVVVFTTLFLQVWRRPGRK